MPCLVERVLMWYALQQGGLLSSIGVVFVCSKSWRRSILRSALESPVLGPQRLEVDGEADLAAAVHLGGLALQLWQLNLRGHWLGMTRGRTELLRNQVALLLISMRHSPARSSITNNQLWQLHLGGHWSAMTTGLHAQNQSKPAPQPAQHLLDQAKTSSHGPPSSTPAGYVAGTSNWKSNSYLM